MSILIKDVFLEEKKVDILIQGEIIQKIDSQIECKVKKVIDGQKKVALPTFFNVHTHAAMTLLRGYADDLELHSWLNDYIWPFERKLTYEDVYVGTKLACLEMIKTGTTFFCDMYWHPLAAKQAVEEMGLRAAISTVFVDFGDNKKASEFKKRTEKFFTDNKDSDLVQFILGPHAIYTVSKESLIWLKDFAIEHDILIHIHLAETKKEVEDCVNEHGLTPVNYLDSIGFFDAKVLAAHGVWVGSEEIEILKRKNVCIAHVPLSNMKLASGICSFYKMYKNGILAGLGTDGCASNNNLDMFEEMKFTSLLAKVNSMDPTIFKAKEIFDIATSNGADIFNFRAGRIKEGFLADLMLVDLENFLMVPNHNLYSNLVYSAQGRCVDTVICNGKVLMENKVVPGEKEIIAEAKESVAKILERLKKS
ncbi:5-methylthioadenosine/S-adenosylhomocysteine deaminase [Desulfonauticus submarinus]|uniref:5-methylthioadenosine/S-adenosylhomocysteine deaminase n=1 Tax=Desulfonauticus submarinus TaxID=206665 RepID=A0A1H0DJE0_9BACT|nr:amidohydrolase [Desulfonauticus submarinus]SDN70377.1 5-methylthioadenosine/S-adenosylhomocysteine deaminase [Desulfonauticus submarinus]